MKTVTLHICDPDEIYLDRLDGFIQHRERSPFCVRTYTTADSVCHAVDESGILLLNSELFSAVAEKISSHELPVLWRRIVLINEGNFDRNALTTLSHETDLQIDIIDKYQSAGLIYAYLLDTCVGPQEQLYARGSDKNERCVQVIGVYAPDFTERDSFARNLAKKHVPDSLYISFEELSDTVSPGRSLSDMIVAIKEKSDGILLKQENYLISEDGLDILPPAACPYDIGEVHEDEWFYWLEQLILYGRYTTIVINFGCALPNLILLELCTKVYLPCTAATEEKCRRFETILEFMGKKDVLNKLEIKLTGGVRHGLL